TPVLKEYRNLVLVEYSPLQSKNSPANPFPSQVIGLSLEDWISDGTTLRQVSEWLGIEIAIACMSQLATGSENKLQRYLQQVYDPGLNGSPGLGPTTDSSTTKAQASSSPPSTDPKA